MYFSFTHIPMSSLIKIQIQNLTITKNNLSGLVSPVSTFLFEGFLVSCRIFG